MSECNSCKAKVADKYDLTALDDQPDVKLCTICYELNELAHESGGLHMVRDCLVGLYSLSDRLYAAEEE